MIPFKVRHDSAVYVAILFPTVFDSLIDWGVLNFNLVWDQKWLHSTAVALPLYARTAHWAAHLHAAAVVARRVFKVNAASATGPPCRLMKTVCSQSAVPLLQAGLTWTGPHAHDNDDMSRHFSPARASNARTASHSGSEAGGDLLSSAENSALLPAL